MMESLSLTKAKLNCDALTGTSQHHPFTFVQLSLLVLIPCSEWVVNSAAAN